MITTTTPNVEGKKITQYFGIVTGEAIMGANLFRDLFAGIRDIVGGRSASYEKELSQARQMALQEMEAMALQRGANAVVGVDRSGLRSAGHRKWHADGDGKRHRGESRVTPVASAASAPAFDFLRMFFVKIK
jgi:uncharacterized protein YbjQ (UPF0145 family)